MTIEPVFNLKGHKMRRNTNYRWKNNGIIIAKGNKVIR